ncbi:MAG: hypothetical protein M3N18_06300 [Actinomycetota bacterium]|nr:hypothetical protein [Actinomycetota bacterium]
MGEDTRQDATGPPSTSRVSVQEAAEHLGTTVDAIRKRVQRGTITHDKDPGGRVWILLDTDRTRHDDDQDATGQRQDSSDSPPGEDLRAEMVDELRDRVRYLERQLETEQRAHGETRRIVAGLVQRIPELEAPSEARESPVSPGPSDTPTSAPGEAHAATERLETRETQAGGERSPWWRRLFR